MKGQPSTSDVMVDLVYEKSSTESANYKNADEGSYGINGDKKEQNQSDAESFEAFRHSFKMTLQDRKFLKARSYVKLAGNKKRNSKKTKQRKRRFGSKC